MNSSGFCGRMKSKFCQGHIGVQVVMFSNCLNMLNQSLQSLDKVWTLFDVLIRFARFQGVNLSVGSYLDYVLHTRKTH